MAQTALLEQAQGIKPSYSSAIDRLQAAANGGRPQGQTVQPAPAQTVKPSYSSAVDRLQAAANGGQSQTQPAPVTPVQTVAHGSGGSIQGNAPAPQIQAQAGNYAAQIAAAQAAIQQQMNSSSTTTTATGTGAAAAPAQQPTGTTAPEQLGQWQVDPRMQQYLENLYSGNLQSNLAALEQQYAGQDAAYAYQLQELAKQNQADLTRNAVENQQAQQAWNESRSAYGLSSGTMGQAALARQNRQASGAAALRAANQSAMGKLALEQATAKSKYEAAVRQAIADNDYQKAQALYNAAKEAEQWQQEQYLNELNWQHQLEMAQINYNNQIAAMQAQYQLEHGGVVQQINQSANSTGSLQTASQAAAANMHQVGSINGYSVPMENMPNYDRYLAALEAAGVPAAAPAATPSYTPTATQQMAPAGTQQQTAPPYDAYAAHMASLAGGTGSPKKNGVRP